eukprot:TRINITY_DN11291_c0_g1_i11.p1 TRINITY_DN11291_c0_g1~~TRINITY_DN11291_c0_g1_i11.p1  ORF type:complete len:366 (-),score=40.37 TRINITY_DN11291_c0_g1_i11:177-1274(-)
MDDIDVSYCIVIQYNIYFISVSILSFFFFFQAEDGIRDAQESRGLGDVYKRQDLKGGYCRRNCHQTPDPRMFRVLHMLAHFSPIAVMQEALGVDRNIIGRLVKSMAKAALWDQNNNRPKYSMFAVDETCIGKRLYEQGARTRVAQFWFFTATGINRDGTAISTTWYGTHARNAENAEAFIKSCMAGTRCTIYTDGHKCYYHIGDFCKKHGVVNHSEGFKNDAGEHTNHAEGAHGVVKDIVRAIWTNFGQTGPLVEERAALGAFLFNKGGGHRTRVKQTRARMVALLELFQRCHPATPTYVFEEGPTEPLPGEAVAEAQVGNLRQPPQLHEGQQVAAVCDHHQLGEEGRLEEVGAHREVRQGEGKG